jgi:hypothetical protein
MEVQLRRDYEYTPPSTKVVYALEGLPEGHNQVTTYGGGGGTPIWIRSGVLERWSVGGGKRSQVHGNRYVCAMRRVSRPLLNFSRSFHLSAPVLNWTLPWGFLPISTSLGIYPSTSDANVNLVSVTSLYTLQPTTLIISPQSITKGYLRISSDQEANWSR